MCNRNLGVKKIMKEALFYTKLNENKVRCNICPHYCIITPENRGRCRSRKNIGGVLYALNYGKTITVSIDPMEKKPLYHFHPGRNIISLGPNSCNLACRFCQNYHSSQLEVSTTKITPTKILELCRAHACEFVAFTYTEPTTWYEFVLDSSKFLKKNGIRIVLVTNGFINQKPLAKLLPYIDAMNIDLKAFDENFYKKICNGSLDPILDTIQTASKSCHLEITNLIITDANDTKNQISDLVDFLVHVNPEIPLHFSRYYPTYKMNNFATTFSTLEMAKKIALKKMKYVYLGNVSTERSTTICPHCDHLLIRRDHPLQNNIVDGHCTNCNYKIYGEF